VLSQVLKTAITSFGDEATPTVTSAPSPSGRVSTLDADLQFHAVPLRCSCAHSRRRRDR